MPSRQTWENPSVPVAEKNGKNSRRISCGAARRGNKSSEFPPLIWISRQIGRNYKQHLQRNSSFCIEYLEPRGCPTRVFAVWNFAHISLWRNRKFFFVPISDLSFFLDSFMKKCEIRNIGVWKKRQLYLNSFIHHKDTRALNVSIFRQFTFISRYRLRIFVQCTAQITTNSELSDFFFLLPRMLSEIKALYTFIFNSVYNRVMAQLENSIF